MQSSAARQSLRRLATVSGRMPSLWKSSAAQDGGSS
jgi:hypothetical protein